VDTAFVFLQDGMEAEEVRAALASETEVYANGINVSVSSAPSTRLDFNERGLKDVVRVSPHYYNSMAEIYYFIEALKGTLARDRAKSLLEARA
jgi:cysteine desulfurase / selenocysteine lyase